MGAIAYMLVGRNVSHPDVATLPWGQPWYFGEVDGIDSPLKLGSEPDLGGAAFKFNWLSTVEQDGATFNGRNDEVNTFSLDVICKRHAFRGEAAVRLYLEWRMSLGRGEEQLMFVTITERGSRQQLVRLAEPLPALDLVGVRARGGFRDKPKFVIDQSFWMGDVIERNAAYPDVMSSLTIDNKGDREGFLTYEITGPVTSPSLGVDGEVVTLTGTTIPAGQTWTISTTPTDRYIKNHLGANMAPAVSAAAGHPVFWSKGVPSWAVAAPIHFGGTGVGAGTAIRAILQQTYWGGVA